MTAWETTVERAKQNPRGFILGPDHVGQFIYGHADHFEDKGWPHDKQNDDDLVLVGIHVNHRTDDGQTCGGHVTFALPLRPSEHEKQRALWEVQSLDPLTISPSVQCHCSNSNNHGFIREGKWVPA